jgi:hypothetical protein
MLIIGHIICQLLTMNPAYAPALSPIAVQRAATAMKTLHPVKPSQIRAAAGPTPAITENTFLTITRRYLPELINLSPMKLTGKEQRTVAM